MTKHSFICNDSINNYEIKEIALNPMYVTKEYFETLKIQGLSQGINVRWMTKNEYAENNIFTVLVKD